MVHADEQFEQFVQAYPAARRQRGYLATTLFLAALEKVSFETLMAALAQQQRSEQWQTPRHIPLMTTWLEQERWIQVLPEPTLSVADEARRWARLTPMEQARQLRLKK